MFARSSRRSTIARAGVDAAIGIVGGATLIAGVAGTAVAGVARAAIPGVSGIARAAITGVGGTTFVLGGAASGFARAGSAGATVL
jgi:hypothetical protein